MGPKMANSYHHSAETSSYVILLENLRCLVADGSMVDFDAK